MGIAKDHKGKTVGILTVIKRLVQRDRYGNILWDCRCECGNIKVCTSANIQHKQVYSCGCKYRGTIHGDWNKRIRVIWVNMIRRCSKVDDRQYKDYGGRGIKVCDEWKDYTVFKRWAYENGYTDDLTLERIRVNENYEPGNCRFATYKEQARNKRNNKHLTFNGESKTVAEWADVYGINQNRINRRLIMGWSPEAAITKPIDKNKISKIYRHGTIS